MKALFLTQSRSLAMFYDLMAVLGPMESAGFYVADRRYFRDFSRAHPDINGLALVKEWEVIEKSAHGAPDLARLAEIEGRLALSNLTRAIVADRRLYFGPLCTLRQDYRPRFTYQRTLRILEEGVSALTRLFDQVMPDVVFSFVCVTFGEYLATLIARSRDIPVLNLRPTRIENYVTLAPGFVEPSGFVAETMAGSRGPLTDDVLDEARRCLDRFRGGAGKYEGVYPVSSRPPRARRLNEAVWPRLAGLVRGQWESTFGELADDHHVPPPAQVFFYKRIANPVRAWHVHRRLQGRLLQRADLVNLDYAFFPLHTEPEVTLLVHSPAWLNQIEVVRLVSHSLPAGQWLVVKEHPASIGKRPASYYRKLLDIPNVLLADPGLDSTTLIKGARLVATIAGSIGFEAALHGKPVVTLGDTPYELLPDTMVRRVRVPSDLGTQIRSLLRDYRFDERAVIHYMASTIRCSGRVNLYSMLLGREGVYVPGGQRDWDQEIQALGELSRRLWQGCSVVRVPSETNEPVAGASR